METADLRDGFLCGAHTGQHGSDVDGPARFRPSGRGRSNDPHAIRFVGECGFDFDSGRRAVGIVGRFCNAVADSLISNLDRVWGEHLP